MLRYTELHPDVIESENILASLKDQRDSEIEAYYYRRRWDRSDQNWLYRKWIAPRSEPIATALIAFIKSHAVKLPN